MSAMTTQARRERLEARVTAEQKALLQRAAALEGRSLTDFILSSIQTAAQAAIEKHERLTLTARDSAAFVDALLHPTAPNERLRAAVERHRTLISE
jgi:uncharacterized protein (DUF1778 family)